MAKRGTRPIEYSILYTATLCMLAVGAVMVYSASSAESLLDGSSATSPSASSGSRRCCSPRATAWCWRVV
jgi:hypothetical protein